MTRSVYILSLLTLFRFFTFFLFFLLPYNYKHVIFY
ncbi:hypothetical protein EVA_19258 [gut metagenome]|uniref:Uncharacterized protein n=1 Tax=gut metagenome TaxID=749906 RepID=J9BYK5_9ZZZZ